MKSEQSRLDLLSDLVSRARAAGADAADAVLDESTSISVAWRLGKQERLERSEAADVGLRVFVGRRQAIAASSDLAPSALADLVERALAMARAVPEDPHCGIAEADAVAAEIADVDSREADEPSIEALAERAARAEDAARAVPGVTNSEGAEAGWGVRTRALVASNGFAGTHARSWHSLSASVLAGTGTAMERDYDYSGAVYAEDLLDAEALGRSAGERAVRRLGPRKAGSAQVPVVYDPRVSRSLLGHLAAAANGSAVARGTTFLKDRVGTDLFPASVTVVDDPLRPRGLRSRPFDGESIAAAAVELIDAGTLTTWILDLRSARQLGLASNGRASRGVSAPPSPATTNLFMKPGTVSPQALIADIARGFYVTELIGFGVNTVTGDYSRGASGFWIEDGALAYPVNEVTVAGTLTEMFANLTPADDLEFRYGTDAPTVRIEGMTVAGR